MDVTSNGGIFTPAEQQVYPGAVVGASVAVDIAPGIEPGCRACRRAFQDRPARSAPHAWVQSALVLVVAVQCAEIAIRRQVVEYQLCLTYVFRRHRNARLGDINLVDYGIAIADMIARIATAIMISISVKPSLSTQWSHSMDQANV